MTSNIFEQDVTFLTNMQEKKRPALLATMKKFPNLVRVNEQAFSGDGRKLNGYFAVHSVDGGYDLSEFWREFDRQGIIHNV